MGPLPAPGVTWTEAYEVLRELGRAIPVPTRRASETLAVIAGMQAGETMDEWLLRELLALSGLDLSDPGHAEAVGAAVSAFLGAGLLDVEWEAASHLRELTRTFDGGFGSRHSNTFRDGVVRRMRRLEQILGEDEDAA